MTKNEIRQCENEWKENFKKELKENNLGQYRIIEKELIVSKTNSIEKGKNGRF